MHKAITRGEQITPVLSEFGALMSPEEFSYDSLTNFRLIGDLSEYIDCRSITEE